MLRPLAIHTAALALSLTAAEDLSDPRMLLAAVGARYDRAIDYSLAFETESKSTLTGRVYSFEYRMAASRPRQSMMRQIARWGEPSDLLLIASSGKSWAYQARTGFFTEGTASDAPERAELARQHERYFRRFRMLGSIDAAVRRLGDENVTSDGKPVRCVRLRMTAADQRWTEELWIDPKRLLVLKLVSRHKPPFPEAGEIVTTTSWTESSVDEPVDPSLFEFRPPEGARRTNAIEFR